MQNFSFCGAGCSFWYLFWWFFLPFFMQNFSFLRGWEVFLSKKKTIFSCKTSVFAGLGALFDTFFCDFCVIFLKCANPARRSARSARGLTRDAKAVSGKPEGTILVRPASFAPHCRPPTPLVVGSEVTRYDSPKLIVGSEGRGYDSPKLIVGSEGRGDDSPKLIVGSEGRGDDSPKLIVKVKVKVK